MTVTVADALATALKRHGVHEIFGQSLPSALFIAAEKQGIRQVVYRTENAGGAMADGYARVSNRIGVVGAQNGPAATLLVAPLSEAMKASVPMLALVQDVPSPTRDKNAFQELDHFSLFQSCAKWIRQLNDAARVEDYLDMAITAATTGRPGPVVLLLPKDVLIAPVQPGRITRTAILGTFPLDPTRPPATSVREAARLLAEAENPVVVAGGGIHLSQASAVLAHLQEVASLPVVTTNMGKGSVAETHPLSIGVMGNVMGRRSSTHYMRDLIMSADVVMLAGTRTNENGTDSWNALPADARFIHIDVDGAEIGRNYEAFRLAGDVRLALEDLAVELERTDLSKRTAARGRIVDAIARGRESHKSDVTGLLNSGAVPIRPERIMTEIDKAMTPGTIVVADASYSTIWVSNYLKARRPGQRFLLPRGMAGLGWGLPMAIGAKVARPDSPVICVSGDGGFGHVWQEMETLQRMQIPVTIILLNNSVLAFQKHSELFQFSAHTSAVNFSPVDHAAIARACGIGGVRVTDPADLEPAIRAGVASNKPTLIEVVIDPDAYPSITLWETRDILPTVDLV